MHFAESETDQLYSVRLSKKNMLRLGCTPFASIRANFAYNICRDVEEAFTIRAEVAGMPLYLITPHISKEKSHKNSC